MKKIAKKTIISMMVALTLMVGAGALIASQTGNVVKADSFSIDPPIE